MHASGFPRRSAAIRESWWNITSGSIENELSQGKPK